jgi:hypothetical protein
MSHVLKAYDEALSSRAYHEQKLEEACTQLDRLRVEVDQVIKNAANRLIVDDQGHPIQGGVFWWEHKVICRINGEIYLIPVKVVDLKDIIPPAEAETLADVIVAELTHAV